MALRVRWTCAIICMIIFALGGFAAIFVLLKYKLLVEYVKDPPGIECDIVKDAYGEGDSLAQVAYQEMKQWELLR